MPTSSRRILPQHVVAAALVVATVALFSPARTFQFLSIDDTSYVSENVVVARGLTVAGLRWAFTSFFEGNWGPLTWLSHMLDVQLFGLAPGGHHVTSVLLHALNAALLFWLLWAMTGTVGCSAAVAALFSVHPLRAESVVWVAERKDVLSGLFWMLTLIAYLRWVRRPSAGRYLRALAAFTLGLLSKPMLVTLPFVLLLLDFWPLDRLRLQTDRGAGTPAGSGVPLPRLLLEKLPFLSLAIVTGVIAYFAQDSAGAIRSVQRYTFAIRVSNAIHSYVSYLAKTLRPTDLTMFYPHAGPGLDPRLVLAAGLLLAAITLVAVLTARARPYLLTGWLWYVGTLVPVIGIVQVGAHAMADRFTYLPLIGVFIAVAWGVPDILPAWRRRGQVLALCTAVLCLLLAFLTTRQMATMRDDETLYRYMLSVNPDNLVAINNLGLALVRQGRMAEGTALMSEGYRRNPLQLTRVHLQMAAQLTREGKLDEALVHYRKVLDLDPLNAEALGSVARLTAAEVRTPRSADPAATPRGANDGQEAGAWFRQGNALSASGHFERSVEYYRRAVALKPDFVDAWNNLGSSYGRLDRHREAAAAFEQALAVDPGNARARMNLAKARRSLLP